MKKLIACLLFLLLAVPAFAEEKDDDDVLVYETLIIKPNIKNADNEDMPAIINALMERIKTPAVLGDAAGKIVIEPTFASSLEYGTFSLERYPQLKEYKEDVKKSYDALEDLKKTPEFARAGLHCRAGKEWQAQNDRFAKKYEKIELPIKFHNAFFSLNFLASKYTYIRIGQFKNVDELSRWENEYFTAKKDVFRTLHDLVIDD